jgi:two-component system invasion response regulator UvrY
MTTTPHILILEDHEIVTTSLRNVIIETIPDSQIYTAGSFPKGLEILNSGNHFDLILLDIQLPGGLSYGMISALRNLQPAVRILVFTGNEEPKHALNFLSAGANGYLCKNVSLTEIAGAIRTVMEGKKYMTDQVHQLVAESFFKKISPSKVFENDALSPRELEVLQLLLEGKLSKHIAQELNLKITTVSTHKTRIFEKMQVTNIIELFRKLKPEG